MREVIVAKSAGFCFGVKRAVDTAYECAKKSNKVYTYGPIIHNEEVINDLTEKGVSIIENLDEAKTVMGAFEGNTVDVVIRSHGVTETVHTGLHELGFNVTDATCPFVKKIHNIVAKEASEGNTVVVFGNGSHPEVEGIVDWGKGRCMVLESKEEIESLELPLDTNISVVAQTTFNLNKFNNLVDILQNKYYNVRVYDTICNATRVRQEEAASLARSVDVMIVIGGQHSSNTQKLFEICTKECKNTYYIQTLIDLDLTAIESAERVGITAGASTPNYIIKEVHDACQN